MMLFHILSDFDASCRSKELHDLKISLSFLGSLILGRWACFCLFVYDCFDSWFVVCVCLYYSFPIPFSVASHECRFPRKFRFRVHGVQGLSHPSPCSPYAPRSFYHVESTVSVRVCFLLTFLSAPHGHRLVCLVANMRAPLFPEEGQDSPE